MGNGYACSRIDKAGGGSRGRSQFRGPDPKAEGPQIVEVAGHPQVEQIQVHPGGGRRGGAYVTISTSTEGKIKVVDPATYKPTPGEKARVVPFRGGGG